MTMFINDSFPLLKGKAAEVRGLALPLCRVVEILLDDTEQVHRWVKKLMLAIVQIEQILTIHKEAFCLPADVAQEFMGSCDAVAALNTALGQHFHHRGILLFNHTIKFHYCQHIGIVSAYINPRMAWCYSGEDLLQKVRSIVQSCNRGSKLVAVPQKALLKYARGLNYKLAGGFVVR